MQAHWVTLIRSHAHTYKHTMQELTGVEARRQTCMTGSLWVGLACGSSVVNAPDVVVDLPVYEGAVVIR